MKRSLLIKNIALIFIITFSCTIGCKKQNLLKSSNKFNKKINLSKNINEYDLFKNPLIEINKLNQIDIKDKTYYELKKEYEEILKKYEKLKHKYKILFEKYKSEKSKLYKYKYFLQKYKLAIKKYEKLLKKYKYLLDKHDTKEPEKTIDSTYKIIPKPTVIKKDSVKDLEDMDLKSIIQCKDKNVCLTTKTNYGWRFSITKKETKIYSSSAQEHLHSYFIFLSSGIAIHRTALSEHFYKKLQICCWDIKNKIFTITCHKPVYDATTFNILIPEEIVVNSLEKDGDKLTGTITKFNYTINNKPCQLTNGKMNFYVHNEY